MQGEEETVERESERLARRLEKLEEAQSGDRSNAAEMEASLKGLAADADAWKARKAELRELTEEMARRDQEIEAVAEAREAALQAEAKAAHEADCANAAKASDLGVQLLETRYVELAKELAEVLADIDVLNGVVRAHVRRARAAGKHSQVQLPASRLCEGRWRTSLDGAVIPNPLPGADTIWPPKGDEPDAMQARACARLQKRGLYLKDIRCGAPESQPVAAE